MKYRVVQVGASGLPVEVARFMLRVDAELFIAPMRALFPSISFSLQEVDE